MAMFSLLASLLLSTLPCYLRTHLNIAVQGASVQATVLVQESLSALNGGQAVNDVNISANAHRIAGSDDDTGTATLQAVAAGASSVTLNLPSGQLTEIVNSSATPPSGMWVGPDGTVHTTAFHNLLAGPFWFFPEFALAVSSSTSGAVITYVGHETHNGEAVEHLSISQSPAVGTPQSYASYAQLTQLDFFLDSTTFLPAALDFNTHPDNNALLDIPVEVRFTNYVLVSGVQVPFHVQKFINNTLALDIQFQTASLNSGTSVAQIINQ
jgi:hypothetical protein